MDILGSSPQLERGTQHYQGTFLQKSWFLDHISLARKILLTLSLHGILPIPGCSIKVHAQSPFKLLAKKAILMLTTTVLREVKSEWDGREEEI